MPPTSLLRGSPQHLDRGYCSSHKSVSRQGQWQESSYCCRADLSVDTAGHAAVCDAAGGGSTNLAASFHAAGSTVPVLHMCVRGSGLQRGWQRLSCLRLSKSCRLELDQAANREIIAGHAAVRDSAGEMQQEACSSFRVACSKTRRIPYRTTACGSAASEAAAFAMLAVHKR